MRDYSLHSTVARGFDDSGWFAGPTLPYKIREELPVTRPESVSNRPLSVILKREHRAAKLSGRRLVAVSFDDAARFRARVRAVVHHLYAVNENLGDASCQLARFLKGGVVLDQGGIEDSNVGKVSRSEHASVRNTEVGRR